MPVAPGNQFQSGGPRPVVPNVIYNQKAPQGLVGGLIQNLAGLAGLAGSIKEMVEGDPTKAALAKQYEAIAESQRASAEVQRAGIPRAERNHWQTISNGYLEILAKTPADLRAQRAEEFARTVPDEFKETILGAGRASAEEQAAYRLAKSPLPGNAAGQSPQPPSPPSGQEVPQAPTAPPPPPPTFEGVEPPQAKSPMSPPPTFGEIPPGSMPGATVPSPPPQAALPTEGLPPPIDGQAPVTAPAPAVMPTQEPFVRTAAGPVPNIVQRPLMTAEQFQQAQASGSPINPNDVLPFAEATANPTFNRAVEAAAAEVVPEILNPIYDMARVRVLGAVRRGETPSVDDLVMAQMDTNRAELFIQSKMAGLGIPHPGASDLGQIVELAHFLRSQGKGWKTEQLQGLFDRYNKDPLLLGAQLGFAQHMVQSEIDLEKLNHELEVARINAASRERVAQIGYAGTVGAAQIRADVGREANRIAMERLGFDVSDAQSKRYQARLQQAQTGLAATDTRINEIYTRLAQSNLPSSVVEKVKIATAQSQAVRIAEYGIIDARRRLAALDARLGDKSVVGVGVDPDTLEIDPNIDPNSSKYNRAQQKQAWLRERRDTVETIENMEASLIDGTDAQGRPRKGLRTLALESASALSQDPAVQQAVQNPKSPGSAAILDITTRFQQLQQTRAGYQQTVDFLTDPAKVEQALTHLATQWQADVPSFSAFMSHPLNGGYSLRAFNLPEDLAVHYYSTFKEAVRENQRRRKQQAQRPKKAAGSQKQP